MLGFAGLMGSEQGMHWGMWGVCSLLAPAAIQGSIAVSLHHPFCHPVLQGLSLVGISKGKIELLFIGGAPAALPTATLTVQIAAQRKTQSSVLLWHFPLEQPAEVLFC